MTGEKKKVRSSGPCEGSPNPQASPWDAWQRWPAPRVEFPASDGHRGDTRACPVGGSWVPTSLNKLELELGTADSKVPKKPLKQTSYRLGHMPLGGRARFCENRAGSVGEGG